MVTQNFVKALQTLRKWYQQQIRSCLPKHSFRGFVSLFLVGASLSVVIAACSGNNADTSSSANLTAGRDVKLTLVSYSVTKAAYEQIIPKFVEKWKKEHNQNVTFDQSYGGSGSQTDAVINGSQQADVVHLSLALDVNKIQQAGLIKPDWEKKAPKGSIVTRSVAAIVTRPGNPKGIKTWADLAKDDVQVITANPKTSGGARWNFLAFWGSVTHTGGDEAKALQFTTKVYKNAPVLPASAREASDLFFQQGQGDVLINYEDEVILAGLNGQKLSYVVPKVNISIDNPVAVVDKNVDKHGTREVATAFVNFLYTSVAQQEFAKVGFRLVDPIVGEEVAHKYPLLQTLYTVRDFGGWDAVQKKFFDDGAIFDKIRTANKA